MDKTCNLINELQKEIDALRAKQAISDAAIEHLKAIYKTAWIECCYDAYNSKSYESAHVIYPHIQALQDELKFNN